MSWLGKLHQMRAELAERSADPWRKKVEGAVRGEDAISTAALLDLLRVPATTGTARRLAKIMRSMGFIPIRAFFVWAESNSPQEDSQKGGVERVFGV